MRYQNLQLLILWQRSSKDRESMFCKLFFILMSRIKKKQHPRTQLTVTYIHCTMKVGKRYSKVDTAMHKNLSCLRKTIPSLHPWTSVSLWYSGFPLEHQALTSTHRICFRHHCSQLCPYAQSSVKEAEPFIPTAGKAAPQHFISNTSKSLWNWGEILIDDTALGRYLVLALHF